MLPWIKLMARAVGVTFSGCPIITVSLPTTSISPFELVAGDGGGDAQTIASGNKLRC